ncbi:hypothetical protein LGL08_00255 [Clostridium estertheticum]|uniref:STM3941 family protein n=1 Tax=Clostridium estertheticum TaxID=238834 RepID=UPI001CF1BC75|nr:STM3941 family protein [Clostridium estertheticum]MCB2305646.1 hypothetical protein [Clostridium estertheticum]MCB2344539.1 hypothetical protein [Clostridium estertheticum]MCB2348001.1 hypothetical protein [Clostridium estertheticum]WAG45646.1 hypothetical protein LL127_19340 [Clostridium estertheticum]
MNEIIIKEDKKKAINLIVLGSVFLIIGIYALAMGAIEKELFYAIIGAVVVIVFSAVLISIVKRTLNSTPLLLIGKDGITDMSTLCSVGFLEWKEIQSINIQKSFGQRYIGLNVYKLNELMKRISITKRIAMKVNLIFRHPPVLILLDTANIEFNEAVSLIQMRLVEHRRN